MKMFWQRNKIINGLRGQIVFAEITVIFLCINIGAVHGVGMSIKSKDRVQGMGGHHAGTQWFQGLLGPLTPLPAPWGTPASVSTVISQKCLHSHKPCRSLSQSQDAPLGQEPSRLKVCL